MGKKIIILIMSLILLGLVTSACTGFGTLSFEVYFMVDGIQYAKVSMSDETITMPPNPTKDGYTFDGWYWDEGEWNQSFTPYSIAKAPLTEKMCVYAHFVLPNGEEGDDEKTKLVITDNIWVEGDWLYWNAVENASGYTIRIDDRDYSCSNTRYNISGISGLHAVKIRANGDGINYSSSDFSGEYPLGAATETGYYSQFDELTKNESFLGYGFDVINSSVFSDKYIKTSAPIFNAEELLNQRLLKVDSKSVSINEIKSESMDEFMSQWNVYANVDVSYGKKKVGGSVNVEAAYSGGYTNAKSKYFHCISFNNQKFYIVLQSDLSSYKKILSEGFKEALYSDLDPAEFFNRYGTHFITSAVMGGRIYSYYLYTSESETNFHDIISDVSVEVRNYSKQVNVDAGGGYKQKASQSGVDIKNTMEVLGGDDFGMMSDSDIAANYKDWESSLNEHASLIGIKDTGSLWPIWDLIDPALDTKQYAYYDIGGQLTYGSRAEQLQAYFYKYGVESYNSLMQSAGLPSIVVPEGLDGIRVNGVSGDENGDYIVYTGTENEITFMVLPETATGYTKKIYLAEEYAYANITSNNLLFLATTAPSNKRIRVVLSAGGVKKEISVITRKTYTVDFYSNCNEIEDPKSIREVRYGYQISEPVIGKRENYTFMGWYTDPDFDPENKYIFGSMSVKSDLSLYAKWVLTSELNIRIKVTLDSNGAVYDTTELVFQKGDCYGNIADPVRTGYTFTGWYYGDIKISSALPLITEQDHTIIAHWNINKYYVHIDTNGGNADWPEKEFEYNSTIILPNVWRDEHNLWYWENQPSANIMPANDITCKAIWVRTDYTYTYYNEAHSEAKIGTKNEYQTYCYDHVDWSLDKYLLREAGYTKMKVTISFEAKKYASESHYTKPVLRFELNGVVRVYDSFTIESNKHYNTITLSFETTPEDIWWMSTCVSCKNTSYHDDWWIKNFTVNYHCYK